MMRMKRSCESPSPTVEPQGKNRGTQKLRSPVRIAKAAHNCVGLISQYHQHGMEEIYEEMKEKRCWQKDKS